MITIIHGTDTASSRKYFLTLKEKKTNPVIVDGRSVDITDLVQIFEGGELFTTSKDFLIEELFGKKSRIAGSSATGKKNEIKSIVAFLEEQSVENNVVLWEEGELSKATLNSFKDPVVQLFRLPQTLFTFLENIRPGNGQKLVALFNEAIKTADSEMIYFMMVRQIRLLLALVDQTGDTIDEVRKMAPWQKSRLQTQADYFEIDELKSFYKKLFEVEVAMKTGNLSSSFASTIDFLLLEI